ncbi:MAG: carboxypeptidase-like regulatory domain-containing protein, partial [Planctomycetota bacterium]
MARLLGYEVEGEDDTRPYAPCAVEPTDDAGVARFRSLPAGSYVIVADAAPHAPSVPRRIEVAPDSVPESTPFLCTVPPGTRVTGSVTTIRHRFVPEWRGLSNEDGRFEVTRVPARVLDLMCEVGGSGTGHRLTIDAARYPVARLWTHRPVTYHGRMTDADTSAPVPGANVIFSTSTATRRALILRRADERGHFDADFVRGNGLVVETNPADDWVPVHATSDPTLRKSHLDPMTPLAIEVHRHPKMTSTVVDSAGRPLPGSVVAMAMANSGRRFPRPEALVYFRARDDGSVALPAPGSRFDGSRVAASRFVPSGESSLDYERLPSSTGTLLAESAADSAETGTAATPRHRRSKNELLARIRVGPLTPAEDETLRLYLRAPGTRGGLYPLPSDTLLRVSPQGECAILGSDFPLLGDGASTVSIIVSGDRVRPASLEVEMGGRTTARSLLVTEGGRKVSGRLRDSDGEPLADYDVRWSSSSAEFAGGRNGLRTPVLGRTGADGRFSLDGLDEGAGELQFGSFAQARELRIEVERAQQSVDTKLEESPLCEISLRLRDSTPVVGAAVRARGLGTMTNSSGSTTDSSGRATVGVSGGSDFELLVRPGSGPRDTAFPAFLSAPLEEGTTSVSLEIDRGVDLTGRLLDQDDHPVPNAPLTLQGPLNVTRHSQTDERGEFRFTSVSRRLRGIRVNTPEGSNWWLPIRDDATEATLRVRRPSFVVESERVPVEIRIVNDSEPARRTPAAAALPLGFQWSAAESYVELPTGGGSVPLCADEPLRLIVYAASGRIRFVDGVTREHSPVTVDMSSPPTRGIRG